MFHIFLRAAVIIVYLPMLLVKLAENEKGVFHVSFVIFESAMCSFLLLVSEVKQ